MPPSTSLTRRAFAKLNLCLAVGPPEPPLRDGRPNPKAGFHPIASWFHAIDLCDDLHVDRRGLDADSVFEVEWAPDAPRPTPIDWPVEQDLAFRAHRLLEQYTHQRLPVHVRLRKRIPVGSGLGGGSSDAAAMLLALRELFELDLSENTLPFLASQLGSDVPYFIDPPAEIPRPAVVTGFGERIVRTGVGAGVATVLLVVPPFGCQTRAVYQAYDRLLEREPMTEEKWWILNFRCGTLALNVARGMPIPPNAPFNDLTLAAVDVQPGLLDVLKHASAAVQGPAHLTGSGSAVFVLPDASQLETARQALSASLPECAVLETRLV